jgi:hypothetical protein
LRILLEDLRVALTKHLSYPLIGYPYIRRSQNAFEWASLTEVTGGKR